MTVAHASGKPDSESPLRASSLGALVNLDPTLGVPIYGQYGTMRGLTEHSPKLFPNNGPPSPKPIKILEIGETSTRPVPKEVVVSSIDSDDVDSIVWALEESNDESTTIEASDDEDREDPPEVIPEESDEDGLAELYMLPSEAGCATFM